MARKIVILRHKYDSDLVLEKSLIWDLRLVWEENGVEVEVVKGIDRHVDADVLFPHIDLTVTPPDYQDFIAQYRRVINRRVVDISKRLISTNLLQCSDDYAGPVIVKTDRNYGGLPEEWAFRRSHGSGLTGTLQRFYAHASSRLKSFLTTTSTREYCNSYQIYSHILDVPSDVFTDLGLIVEKFIPERVGDLFAVRHYTFFGDRSVSFRRLANEPIVKESNSIYIDQIEVSKEIVELRRRFGFDYGKFDYVMHSGRPVLLDANRTPGRYQKSREVVDIADGIDSFLNKPNRTFSLQPV